MLQRLKNGLFNPAEVANYQNDKKIKTLIFFFLLLLILLLPNFLKIFKPNKLDYNEQLIIRNIFINEQIPFEFQNYQLVNKENSDAESKKINIVSGLKIIFTNKENQNIDLVDSNIYIAFTKDGAYYVQSAYKKLLFKYTEYPEFENLDLSGATTDNSEFWEDIFPVINKELEDFQPTTISYLLVDTILGLLGFSLLIAVFQSFQIRGIIKFSKLWQLITYLMLPYVFGKLFDTLFSINFLWLVGAFITITYANILSKVLIQKRV